ERFKLVPKEHFKAAIAPGSERIMVHTSNFRSVKRTLDVIRVFEKVNKKLPSKLLMVGDGPERTSAEQLSRELKISQNVRFLGKQDNIEEILSVSDLFLIPSESESFGLAALEAMACKVPVISSNVGGLPELNVDGVTGFLTEVGDIEAMAEKSLYVLEDCDRLNKFKEAALNRAKDFEISNILPHYENYYMEVIKDTKS